ncbi:MAG: 4-vinyl reductase [Candidatus Diapherotrites archaeon]|nr:4-vinyl reductase [Candidatus Diapherotrites archaeon]
MWDTVAKLLMHKQISFEKGKIEIFGRLSSLLPSDSFVTLQMELETRGLQNLIYFKAKESGAKWFVEMNKYYHLKGMDVIKWGSEIVTFAGWGEAIIVRRDDSKKEIVFNLKNSITAKLHPASVVPVDHLFRGLLCGAMATIYDIELSKIDAVETKCIAMGSPICEFIVKQTSEFDVNNDLVKAQLTPVM